MLFPKLFINHLTPQGMRNFRKAIATLSVVAILSSLVVSTAFAGTFSDVPADAYYFNAVEVLADAGIIDASRTNFEPARNLQRQEAAKLIVESAGKVADVPAVGHFTDVPNTLWSYEYVETAYAHGIVNGYSDAQGNLTGRFGPSDTVTRAQFAKMIVEAFDLPSHTPSSPTFPDVTDTNAWYYQYVETAAHHGIVRGYADGSFGANNNIVRQDGAVMIYRALDDAGVVPGDDDDDDDDDYVPGDIEISLGNTPASAVVPKNATRVPFLVMDVEGEGTLGSLTFERVGAGAPNDFINVYLYDGDKRLTSGRSINSSTHRVTFTGVNYAVSGTSELTLMADMSGASGNVNGFRLVDHTSKDNVSYRNVEGNLMSISNVDVGKVTVTKGANPSNPKLGEKEAKVAEFKLAASSTEAVDVYGITLYAGGTVSTSNISNFVLKQAGVEIASTPMVESNDTIVLSFDSPFALGKGDNRNFELYADIGQSARINDTVITYLENKVDLYSVGSVYGFSVEVDNDVTGTYDGGGSNHSKVTVEGGQITISFQGPSIQDYAVNTKDVQLMRFIVVSQNNVEVRKTNFTFTTNGTETDYTNVELYDVDSGEVLAGPWDPESGDSGLPKSFSDTWSLEAGVERTLAFRADLGNFAPIVGETVQIELNVFGPTDIRNLDNNRNVDPADIVPSSPVVGNDHKVLDGTASVSVAGTPSAQTYINGSSNLDMAGFVVSAGAGKDSYLKSLTVEAVGANSCSTESDCVLTVTLWDGSTQLGQTRSLSSTNMATFSSLNLKIAKGSSKTLTVKTSLNTLAAVAGGTTLRYEIPLASDMTLQDSEGNAIVPSLAATPLVGPAHTIAAAGTVTVVRAPNESNVTDSRIVVAGTAGVTLAKFRMTASNEALKLAKVPVDVTAGATASTEVVNLYLYEGTTMVAGPVTPDGNGLAVFTTFAQDFVIPKNGTNTLSVVADLATTDDAVSGAAIVATLMSSSADFEIRSAGGSNTTIYGNVAGLLDVAGNEMRIRKTNLTLSRVALSETNILGTSELYKFNVEVTPGKTASIKQLKFEVDNGTSGAVAGYELYRNDVLVAQSGGGADVGAVVNVVNAGSIDTVTISYRAAVGPKEFELEGGTNQFSLKATVGAGVTVDESITTKLLVDTSLTAGAQTLVDAGAITGFTSGDSANFIWSDMSAVPHDATNGASTPDWANSYLLKSLSLGSQTLIRK